MRRFDSGWASGGRGLGRGLAVGVALAAGPAAACGGFFCQQVPVDQAGENILFAVDGNDVTAHIQITYTGEAQKFSWVLPLPSVPTLGIGTEDVFTALRNNTDPRFQLQVDWVAGCTFDSCQAEDDGFFLDGGDGATGGTDDVSVVAEGDLGPFEYKVVEASDGQALFDWLNENGYDQPEESKPIVTHYVNQEFKFLALRLQKDKSAGDIQPVVVKYSSEEFACVPLKLTSIAATDNMPVRTWVLAEARAVPVNYFHVTLNPKAYPWLECGGWWLGNTDCSTAYTDMVAKAADAANGHAFVTEYAGTSSIMNDVIWSEGRWDTAALKAKTTPAEFLNGMLEQGFPRSSLVQEIIRKYIPKPADVPEDCDEDTEFYTWNLETCLTYMPEGWAFDAAGMADDLEARVVQPAKDAQALFDAHSYLTRVFTTVSPDEMTKDPVFSFNPDLPDVSNVHVTKAKPLCDAGETTASKFEVTYPDGSVEVVPVTFNGCQPPVVGGGGDFTPVADIQTLAESGEASSVAPEDVDATEAKLELRTPTPGQSRLPQSAAAKGKTDAISGTFGAAVNEPATDGTDGNDGADGADGTDAADGTGATDGAGATDGSGSSSSCDARGVRGAAGPWAALALAALALFRRRR